MPECFSRCFKRWLGLSRNWESISLSELGGTVSQRYHSLGITAITTRIIPDKEQTMSSVGYHEPIEELSDATRDMHRAIVSLMEELEAVDWYNQRLEACKDEELKAILTHNRDEEKEHASMVLEWIRRRDPSFSRELKEYLFVDKPIVHE